ncbi:hypothetical protein PAEPH01_0992 [Pancytospora epiphaga]|nr:hypothetical protein PAEPH01_0992 [Pancytospora epiphaga]
MLTFIVNSLVCGAVLYNIHHSFKLQDKASRKFFKHYFVVMSILLALDKVLSFLLYRIPYYQFFKATLLLWLSIPASTGPHFIYNVYIRNIYKLFEGDIDSVISNVKKYLENMKNKYNEMVQKGKKGGEVSINFKNSNPPSVALQEYESSEVEMSNSAVDEDEAGEMKLNAGLKVDKK